MPTTTANMGLKSWPDPKDKFSFSDMATNLKKIDSHTHGLGGGVQLGTTAFAALSVTSAKLGNDLRSPQFAAGALSIDKLISSPLPVPRQIFTVSRLVDESTLAASTVYALARGGATLPSTTGVGAITWQYNAADYVIAGKTTQLVFKGGFSTNAVAMGTAAVNFGLFQGGTPAGSGAVNVAPGTMYQQFTIPGSTAVSTISTLAQQVVTAPTDGQSFVIALSVGAGTVVAGACFNIWWMMGIRWV